MTEPGTRKQRKYQRR
ncbi:unnamed protein product [Leptidea sinapis]|uniref:Uncharacterized protein n=1 Tax=Leptidea sinapis TaxID=189913 RepID=A0A5E4R0B8_9NEOP|nr:unnamed protein product [Leptidea sinapis]